VLPRFFIDRPIFATVISALITLAGALAVRGLPLSQYPPVTPPTIQIDCNYPGASAQIVAETIAAPIEQQVNGVEDMMYMSSSPWPCRTCRTWSGRPGSPPASGRPSC
jgi:multidrug efflux pump subunit AcrB